MAPKLKFLLGFLAVIALLTVFRVGSVFYNNVKDSGTANISNSLAKPDSTKINALTIDSDHDGLPDRDEILYSTNPFKPDTDGDGYLDGEEITTGHDPLDPDSNDKSGSGDTSLSKNPNLTTHTANLTVASLIGDDGQLDPSILTSSTANDIAQSIRTQATLSLFVEPVKDSDIKISSNNSPEALKKYVETIASVIEEGAMAPTKLSEMSFNDGPNSIPAFYQKIYQAISLIEVPSSWQDIHKATLNLLAQVILDSQSLTDDRISQDPIKAIFALNQFQDTVPKFHTLLLAAAQKAKGQNISTTDALLELLKK